MIGRFSKLGVYPELFSLRDFYLAFAAAILALFSLGRVADGLGIQRCYSKRKPLAYPDSTAYAET